MASAMVTDPHLFNKAKQYVMSLGDIDFDNIPVGNTPFAKSNEVYTLKNANDDVIFAIRLLSGARLMEDTKLTPRQSAMVKLNENGNTQEIYKFIHEFSDNSITDKNIQEYNRNHNHVPILHLLNNKAPPLCEYLFDIIKNEKAVNYKLRAANVLGSKIIAPLIKGKKYRQQLTNFTDELRCSKNFRYR
jgi:hypothetical protein